MRRGASRVSVEKFLPYKAEKFRRGTLSFSLFPRIGKKYASKGCHDFLSNFFVSQYRKKSVEEPFCAVFQDISGDEKDYGKEGGYGVIKIFRRTFFASECQKFS